MQRAVQNKAKSSPPRTSALQRREEHSEATPFNAPHRDSVPLAQIIGQPSSAQTPPSSQQAIHDIAQLFAQPHPIDGLWDSIRPDHRPLCIFESEAAPVQRTIDDDVDNVAEQYQNTRDKKLKEILAEVLFDTTKAQVKWGDSDYESHMKTKGNRGPDGRYSRYKVMIDNKRVPDPVKRESFLVHELTHVNSHEKYAFNRTSDPGDITLNLVYNGNQATRDMQFQKQVDLLSELLEQLVKTVENDRATLGNDLTKHLIDRLTRAGGVPHQEFDTVLTELFYYLSKQATPEQAKTATFEKIREAAYFAYLARNKGVPLVDSYASKNIVRGALLGAGAGSLFGGLAGGKLGSGVGGVLGGLTGAFLGKQWGAKKYQPFRLS